MSAIEMIRGRATMRDMARALDELDVDHGEAFYITTLGGTSPRARRSDPLTSHQAAAVVGNLRESQRAVLTIFIDAGRPLIDEELIALYSDALIEDRRRLRNGAPVQSESGIRTRRRELADAGLIEDSGERRANSNGNSSIEWRLAVMSS